MRNIRIFDTTLRDGEQAPGFSMNAREKLEVAHQLEKLGVDIIEAGFAASSAEDFRSLRMIAQAVKDASVCSLSRCSVKDIEDSAAALKSAADPVIHVFLAASDIHLNYKLKMTREQALETVRDSVEYARKFCSKVEFSAEDATRSDREFLSRMVIEAINAGATTINLPDTVGYSTPEEIYSLFKYIQERVSDIDKIVLSAHCHNDLGLAVANTLSAVSAGAGQVELAVNGIGERAGNASLEETVMNFVTRNSVYDVSTNIVSQELYRTSKLVSIATGSVISSNKPIVGANAFAHEAGIHQHGYMSNPLTYEIIKPETVGRYANGIVLGKHSGKHAFEAKILELGYTHLNKPLVDKLFVSFKALAEKKKDIHDSDIEALILKGKAVSDERNYKLDHFVITCGDKFTTMATVALIKEGKVIQNVSEGDGPIDSAFKAIDRITGLKLILEEFNISAVTGGKDAQGTAKVRLRYKDNDVSAVGISTDIIEASIFAYLNGINDIIACLNESEAN